jgi:hypothetical protein
MKYCQLSKLNALNIDFRVKYNKFIITSNQIFISSNRLKTSEFKN